MKRLILLAALALAGCATTAPNGPIRIQLVDREVPVSCVPADLPPAPVYPDTLSAVLSAAGLAERDALIKEGWSLKEARLAALEGVVTTCRQAPQR